MSKTCCVCQTPLWHWWTRPPAVCRCTTDQCLSCWMSERLLTSDCCSICKDRVSIPFCWWYALPYVQRCSVLFRCRAGPLEYKNQLTAIQHAAVFLVHAACLFVLMMPLSLWVRIGVLILQSAAESVMWMRGTHFNVVGALLSLSLLTNMDEYLLGSRLTGYITDTFSIIIFWLQFHNS